MVLTDLPIIMTKTPTGMYYPSYPNVSYMVSRAEVAKAITDLQHYLDTYTDKEITMFNRYQDQQYRR